MQRGNSAPIMDNSPLSIIEMLNYKRKVTDFRFDEAQNSGVQILCYDCKLNTEEIIINNQINYEK